MDGLGVKFPLIEKHGFDKFKLLYAQTDVASATKTLLGIPIEEIDASWRASLAPSGG